jgi:ubiquinol-cytochrome c reductase subunit 6
MSISTFFSSLVGTLHADAPQEEKIIEAEPQEAAAVEEPEEEGPEDVRLPVRSSEGPCR